MKNHLNPFGTVRKEIFLFSFLLFGLVSLLSSGLLLWILYQTNMQSANNSLWQCNSQMVTYAEGLFHENTSVAGILSADDRVIHGGYGDESVVLDIFQEVQKSNENITYLYAGYQGGNLIINDYQTGNDYNLESRAWYQAALEAEDVSRTVYKDWITNEWLFSQSTKLTNEDGEIMGVLSLDCSNEAISGKLSTKYQYESQRSFIVDSEGTVLIHPDETLINLSLLDFMDKQSWQAIINGETNYAEYVKNNKDSMAYAEKIQDADFYVVTAIDSMEIMDPILKSIGIMLCLMMMLSGMLGLLLSYIMNYRFARPIRQLGERIQKIADGRPGKWEESGFTNMEIKNIARHIEQIVNDIANREEMRKAAEYQSFHDSMTGLCNRRFFEEEVQRINDKSNIPLGVICGDINGLKLVNDVFGHDAGDMLICTVAASLKKGCRSQDILVRLGGDEFAVLLPKTEEKEVQEIIFHMQEELPKGGICGADISVSMGYSMRLRMDDTIPDVMRRADKMMYAQKMTESVKMKARTVSKVIAAAEAEGLIEELLSETSYLLGQLAMRLVPEDVFLLKKCYQMRKIGLCSLFQAEKGGKETAAGRHTESGYRILSVQEEYRSMAAYILHYTEHWDGSGWPSGLAGEDIPIHSRIITVVDGYFSSDEDVFKKQACWYDPKLAALCEEILSQMD